MAIAPHKTHHGLAASPVTGSPHCAAHATCHLRRAGSHLGPDGLIALRTRVQWLPTVDCLTCAVGLAWTPLMVPFQSSLFSAGRLPAAPAAAGAGVVRPNGSCCCVPPRDPLFPARPCSGSRASTTSMPSMCGSANAESPRYAAGRLRFALHPTCTIGLYFSNLKRL